MNNKFRTLDLETLNNVTGGATNGNWDWKAPTAAAPSTAWKSGTNTASWNGGAQKSWNWS